MIKKNRAQINGIKALKTVEKVLAGVGWTPAQTDIEGVLRVDFSVDNIAIVDAIADIRIDTERFIFYLNFRDHAAPKNIKQTMEFIILANFDLVIGNFELNLADGFVRFKSSIDFTESVLTETLISNAIQSAMDVVERYSDSLVEVLRGNKKAAGAIKDAEQAGI